MAQDPTLFLGPSPGIQSDHPQVMALAQRLTAGARSPEEAAALLFDFVRDTVRYVPYLPFSRLEDYLALTTLASGKGFCIQKSTLLATLARAVGIPARLGFARIQNHQMPEGLLGALGSDIMDHHCWTEWLLGGSWVRSTPSFEAPLCAQRGWRLVVFSPQRDSVLHKTDLAGRPHISYLEYLGWRAQVPLEEILAGWRATYGASRVERWARGLWKAA